MGEVQPPEGLRVDAMPGLPSVEVAHGIDCVLIVLPAPGPPHHTAATVLWAKQARQLATLLLRQADYAEEQLREHSPVSSTGEEPTDGGPWEVVSDSSEVPDGD